jgi:hypothetical protein
MSQKVDHTTIILTWQEIVALMGLITDRVGNVDISSIEYDIHSNIIGDAFVKLSKGKDVIVQGWRDHDMLS